MALTQGIKITKRTVDAAKPTAKRDYVWDAEVKGFGLLVLPSGVKSYFFRYRTAEGRERRATIGKHGDFTAEQARSRAEELRQAVKSGRDPLKEKMDLRAAPTVTELLDAYVASEKFKSKALTTQAIDRGRIERHLKPVLGRKLAHHLISSDVENAFAAIASGKTAASVKTGRRGRARVTGGRGTAKMAIELLRAAFSWAIKNHKVKVTSNPCDDVATGRSGTRKTILEDATDYARMFQTLDRLELEKRIRGPVADAIRLIALTGARRSEIAGLRWSQVDMKRGQLTLPPHSHKSGGRTGEDREIGLPAAAQAILAKQSAGQPNDLVFAPAGGVGPVSLSKPWRIVRDEAKLPKGIGLHGLRHSLASAMAMAGAGAPQIMQVMGHRQLSTVQRYIHFAQSRHQAVAEQAAATVLAGMAAAKGSEVAELVKIDRSKS